MLGSLLRLAVNGKGRTETGLALMVLLTALGIWQSDRFLNHVRVLQPGPQITAVVRSDESRSGKSTVALEVSDAWRWKCTLRAGFPYPHCALSLSLGSAPGKGVDLRGERRLRLWLKTNGPSKTIRIYLRNVNPAYTRPGEGAPETAKFNQVELRSDLLKDGVLDLELGNFTVANWWLTEFDIPLHLSQAEFTNVTALEVETGSNAALGDYSFELQRVEFEGQRMPTERWYLLIMSLWLTGAFLWLVSRMLRLSGEVRARQHREQELLAVNQLLDQRHQQLDQLAKTDALTGAFNRQGLEEVLQRALTDWRMHQHPLGLVLIDLDHFKSVNDQHGHQAGDRVLTGVSQVVRQNVREQDLLARWGGEEFVLACKNSRLPQALAIAEKLRALIEAHDFGDGLRVTASFGVAVLDRERPLDELFAAADAALYRAKAGGRNCVAAEST